MSGGWGKGSEPADFLLETAKGNVSGHRAIFPFGVKENIIQTEETLWDSDGDFVWPTGNETWEISSDNVNDTLGGTGANVVLIVGLDSNFLEQTEVINLNGISTVTTLRTDWNRIKEILVIFSGSGQRNAGTVTLRVSGGGNIRAVAKPGISSSLNGFITVPDDKYFFLVSSPVFTPKGEDIEVNFFVKADGTNTWLSFAFAPFYQSAFTFTQNTFAALPPKMDIEIRVKSTNNGVTGTVGLEILTVDRKLVNLG